MFLIRLKYIKTNLSFYNFVIVNQALEQLFKLNCVR